MLKTKIKKGEAETIVACRDCVHALYDKNHNPYIIICRIDSGRRFVDWDRICDSFKKSFEATMRKAIKKGEEKL